MSDPVATAADLALWLELDSINEMRATLILRSAQGLCETVVSPVPASAQGVVLAVAARAYSNVNSANQIGLGSAYATMGSTGSGGVGGLYLSKSDRSTLRRLAGRGGAFSIDLLPRGTSEVQSVEVAATAGTFTLCFAGQETSALAFDATAAQVQAALEALSGVGAANVLVEGSFTVSFRNALGFRAVSQIRADDSELTGVVSVVTLVQGSPPAWGA